MLFTSFNKKHDLFNLYAPHVQEFLYKIRLISTKTIFYF